MAVQSESHPDAKSRRQMLEQMHRRAGQQLQPGGNQDKAPQHVKQQVSGDTPTIQDSTR